jgi:hypothetical protein
MAATAGFCRYSDTRGGTANKKIAGPPPIRGLYWNSKSHGLLQNWPAISRLSIPAIIELKDI